MTHNHSALEQSHADHDNLSHFWIIFGTQNNWSKQSKRLPTLAQPITGMKAKVKLRSCSNTLIGKYIRLAGSKGEQWVVSSGTTV